MNEKPLASLEGIRSSKASVIKWRKGSIGVLPVAIANTVKTCWAEKDGLFEGYRASEPLPLANGAVAMRLEGPLKGDPPQLFVLTMSPFADGRPGYAVDMDYPVGSNYEFVRARLAKDIRMLEGGERPC